MRARLAALIGLTGLVAGCGGAPTPGPRQSLPSPPPSLTHHVELREAAAKPSVVIVARDGDPRAAVAVAVAALGGSAGSTALSAIVEARLARAGFVADARADRDGYRVRVLVESKERAAAAVAALQAALSAPLEAGTAELALAARRLAALRHHPLEGAPLDAVARCTGELGLVAGEAELDPASAGGLAKLEELRRGSHGVLRVAFGVVGPKAFGEAAADALRSSTGWANGPAPDEAWPTSDAAAAYAVAGRAPGTARLSFAMFVGDAAAAVATAERAGAPDGPLLRRLTSLSTPWRLVEVAGTARTRGGCLSATLETARPVAGDSIEESAAAAAALTRQELGTELAEVAPSSGGSPALAGDPWRTVVTATDPRDAAALAGWWSLASRGTAPGQPERVALALAVAPPKLDPRESGADPAAHLALASQKLAVALERAEKAWAAPVVERRASVEHGQGELWLLVASPCGTSSEGDADGGATALATLTALAARGPDAAGVRVEPWITPDGIGLLAHGARLAAETPRAHAARVADAAARVLVAGAPPVSAFVSARGTLMGAIGEGPSPDGRALGGLASVLSPAHPSWLAPLGTWDALAKLGADAVAMRWAAVADGPLRVAVLADEDADQAETAARAVDRWMVRRIGHERACPAVDTPASARSGTVTVALGRDVASAQALVGVPAPAPGAPDRALAELAVAALNGPEGWLAKGLGAQLASATATARLVGGSRASALVVDVRAPDAVLEAAIAQVRAIVQRVAQGAATGADLERAVAARGKQELEASLDPRRRVVDLYRGRQPGQEPAPPSLEAWKAWAQSALRDDATAIAIARAKR